MSGVEPIPTEYPRLSPYLAVDNAAAAIELRAPEEMRRRAAKSHD